jgi:sugar phosphate isomerase/epimerase
MVLEFGFHFHIPQDDFEWDQITKVVDDHGFKWIEFEAIEKPNRQIVSRIQKLRDHYDCKIVLHASYLGINLASSNPLVRKASVKAILKEVKVAKQIEVAMIVVHGGDSGWFDILPSDHPEYLSVHKNHIMKRKQSIESLIISLDEIGNYTQTIDPNLRVAVENLYCPWELLSSPEEIEMVLNAVNSAIGFCLDFGHAQISGFSLAKIYYTVSKKLMLLHLHENDLKFDLHLPFSTLRFEWIDVLKQINSFKEKVIPAIIELPNQPMEKVVSSYQTLLSLVES